MRANPQPPTPDFTAILQDALHRRFDPTVARSPITRFLRAAKTTWPQIEQSISRLVGLYAATEIAPTGLDLLNGAQRREAGKVVTPATPWANIAELRFPAGELLGSAARAFVSLNVEVMRGEVGVAIAASEGLKYLGERYFLGVGSHRVQLPIPEPGARGLILCNSGPSQTNAVFRLEQVNVHTFVSSGRVSEFLREMLGTEAKTPPAEVNQPAGVPPGVELVFWHLLGANQTHAAQRLLAATEAILGEGVEWVDERLAGVLRGCCVLSATPSAKPEAPPLVEEEETATLSDHLIGELTFLRQATQDMELIPLHLELLESAAWLDLAAVAHRIPVRFRWERTAIAGVSVRRGLLRALFALIVERSDPAAAKLFVNVTTDALGTSLDVQSTLANGALQYRDHSKTSEDWHSALHHPGAPMPEIQHSLGEEGLVRLHWRFPSVPIIAAEIVAGRSGQETGRCLYSRSDQHRVLLDRGICYKLAPADSAKRNDLIQESALLQHSEHLLFLPQSLGALRTPTGTAMSYRYIPGVTLRCWVEKGGEFPAIRHILVQLSALVEELNRRGVQHRDLRAENILVKPDLSLALIDLDQASAQSESDDFSNDWASGGVLCGFGGLLRQVGWSEAYLRIAGQLGFAWKLGRFSAANSPGKHSCYYAWRLGGLVLPGERPWHLRWSLLRPIFQKMRGGKLLEFGCNLGLLATHASLLGWQATGVDHDAVAVAAADLLASALGGSAQFQTGDLNDPAFFGRLDETYDLVSVLNVLHWLSQTGSIENFLRRQPRILFEGHRSLSDEVAYLQSLGFPHVELLGYSERLRPLLLANKS